MGVAKLQKKDHAELRQMAQRWQTGSTWRFKGIPLRGDEKPAYIHTSCRVVIDLRKAQATALLQSPSFPQTPVPTVTIADVLQLRSMQRFDVMAIVGQIIEERRAGTGMHIADVRLVDGSRQGDSATTEYASLPLTLFFKDAAELRSFKECVGKVPLLFMCLAGISKSDGVSVTTVKNQSWWEIAEGPKSVAMAQEAEKMCGVDANLRDVAALQTYNAHQAVDYISPMATLTAS